MSKIGLQADRTSHASALYSAEKRAKDAKKNLWTDYVEPTVQEKDDTEEAQECSEKMSNESSEKDYQKVNSSFMSTYIV